MASSDERSMRLTSSVRKSWIKTLSARYSGMEELIEEERLSNEDINSGKESTVSTEHTEDPSSKTSTVDTEHDEWTEHETYSVEIIGSADPPAEWAVMEERRKSIDSGSISSADVDHSVETELAGNDRWHLTERDNEILEADMKKDTRELNDASLASDEDSITRTPIERRKVTSGSKAKRISAPAAFPSDFSTVRSSKATEFFTERMKSIEQKNSSKTKSRMAPVIATIGRFSSAFKRFEDREGQRAASEERPLAPSIKVQHSNLSASFSVPTEPTTKVPAKEEPKKLVRTPYETPFIEAPQRSNHDAQSFPTRLTRTPLFPDDQPSGRGSAKSGRAANIPLETSRLIRNVRDSGNAPDVVAATFQPERGESKQTASLSHQARAEFAESGQSCVMEIVDGKEKSMKFSPANQPKEPTSEIRYDPTVRSAEQSSPHFDIDIVIKRDPLPETMSPEEYSREPPTAAITLGRDEVTVMKIDPVNQGSIVSPSEVITVWDTEVPVKDTREKVIPPTKLHVTHFNKGIPLRLASPTSPIQDQFSPSSAAKISSTTTAAEKKERTPTERPTITAEPVLVKIRPQHLQATHTHEFRRSKSHEDELCQKQRSSIALEPAYELDYTNAEQSRHKFQLSASERAIPRRKEMIHAEKQEHISRVVEVTQAHHPPPRQNEPTSSSQPQTWNTQPAHPPRPDNPYRSHPSHGRTIQQRNPRPVSHQPYQPCHVMDDVGELPRVVSEKNKSNSLDDLRLLREGLVANTKAVFSPTREPGKQYFGEPLVQSTAPAMRRPPNSVEGNDYTREWVENSKRTLSPAKDERAPQEKVNLPKYDERQPLSPRGRVVGHRRRTRSLGRAPIKSKAISQMAQFFQDEARHGATHRSVSPVHDDFDSTSAEEQHHMRASSPPASKRSPDRHDESVNPDRPSVSSSFPRKNVPRADKQPQHFSRNQDKNKEQRSGAASNENGIGGFIEHYNNKDMQSKYAVKPHSPRKTLMVREEKLSQEKVQKTFGRAKSLDGADSITEETGGENVDDRPLAASAFKAWFGSDNRLQSPLEQTVEHAYQTHMRIDKRDPVITHKAPGRSQPKKATPWWKQQNEIAAKMGQSQKKEEKKPAASPNHQQTQTSRPNEPPYANYQAQMDDYKPMVDQQRDQVEDYYAQIRKKPTATRTQSLSTVATDDNQLFVQVPPPKPRRSSDYQSMESLDDRSEQIPPELPQRQEMMQEVGSGPQQETANNQSYYDPYVTIENSHNQPQQYTTQPPGAEPYDRSYGREALHRADNFQYAMDEYQHIPTERLEHWEPQSVHRDNRVYPRQEPVPQAQSSWEQRNPPYPGWRDGTEPTTRWGRDPPYNDWRSGPPQEYRGPPQDRRRNEPVAREYTTQQPDPRYNTWSERADHQRSRPAQSELRPHNTLPYRHDGRSQSYRAAHPSTRSFERPRPNDPRIDVQPLEGHTDRRPRRARSVPITRPPQQRSSKPAENKHLKQKGSSKHEHPKSKSDDGNTKSSRSKDRSGKSKHHKEPEIRPPAQFDTTPLPDFIPSHYFAERAPEQPPAPTNQRSQYIQPDYPLHPPMSYNQQSYHQQPMSRGAQNMPNNPMNYGKRVTYTVYSDRPRPGVGVMFNPVIGTTDF